MLIINQNFNKSMEVGTEKYLLSRVCPKLTAYQVSDRGVASWSVSLVFCLSNKVPYNIFSKLYRETCRNFLVDKYIFKRFPIN